MDQSLRPKAEIVVIGVGNEYRGDDGVGPFIVRRLKPMYPPGTFVRLESGEGTSLMESWKDADVVILLDAVNSSARPGKVYRFDAHTQPLPSRFFNYSTHNLGLAEAVELARRLKQLPPCIIIYGIEGKSFKVGTGLSPEVRKAACEVKERVIRDICEKLGTFP